MPQLERNCEVIFLGIKRNIRKYETELNLPKLQKKNKNKAE